MTFSVDPLALNGYAALLGRARDDAERCKTYFATNVPDVFPGVDGMFNLLSAEHPAVQQKLGAMLDQLITLLGACRDEMALSATRYRDSDEKAAAKVDDAYPVVTRPRKD